MSAAQLYLPANRAFNSNGLPLAGAVLKLYTTGTNTPQPFYLDAALTQPVQTVTANAGGHFTPPYQDNATPFRLRIEDKNGLEIDDIDPFYFGTMNVSLDAIYPAAVGTLADMPTTTIPTGIDIVSTTGADAIDHGGGNYIAGTAPTARSGFTSANSRNFVLSKEQVITPAQFYQATDPDYQNAAQGALDYLATLALSGYGYANVAPSLIFPVSPAGPYLFHDELAPECGLNISGESGIQGSGTVLEWTGSTGHGIKLQGWDGSLRHAMGSTVRGLHLRGWYSGPSDRAAKHGIDVSCATVIDDCFFERWPGIAVNAHGDTATSSGNCNGSTFRNLFAQSCDLTLKMQGGDANGCVSYNIGGVQNRLGNYWDNSFLGCTLLGGIGEDNIDTNFLFRCEKSGHIYVVAYGQEAWCSTNAPTGAATSNQGWLYLNDAAPYWYAPTWTTGQTWYFATPFMVGPPDNGNTLGQMLGIYVEGGQNPIILAPAATCTTTTIDDVRVWQQDGTSHGGFFHGSATTLRLNNGLSLPGNVTAQGAAHYFGTSSGVATDLIFNFNTTNTTYLLFNRYNSDGSLAALDGYILNAVGAIYVNGVFGVHLRFNGADVANAVSTGLDLPTGKVLSVNGTQVVGARQGGWTAATGTPARGSFAAAAAGTVSAAYVQAEAQASRDRIAALEARFIALEADARSHGLIS